MAYMMRKDEPWLFRALVVAFITLVGAIIAIVVVLLKGGV